MSNSGVWSGGGIGMDRPCSCYFLVGVLSALSLFCSLPPMALEMTPVQDMTVWHSMHLYSSGDRRMVELRAHAALLSSGWADVFPQSPAPIELRVPTSLLIHLQSGEISDRTPTTAPEAYPPARHEQERLRVSGHECR